MKYIELRIHEYHFISEIIYINQFNVIYYILYYSEIMLFNYYYPISDEIVQSGILNTTYFLYVLIVS